MKTPEDEAFDELARKQGMWGGGFQAKRQAAMDKINSEFHEEYIKYRTAFPKEYTAPQPAQEPDALTIAYQSGFYDGKKAALAGREWNFCERCGKRTADKTAIHTCTPPQGAA
jgi:hypothetical protein